MWASGETVSYLCESGKVWVQLSRGPHQKKEKLVKQITKFPVKVNYSV